MDALPGDFWLAAGSNQVAACSRPHEAGAPTSSQEQE